MPTTTDFQLHTFKDWIFRLRMPPTKPQRLLVLMHGWMGDENSMGVLARSLPSEIAIMSPRGIYTVPEGGYSWREIQPGTWGLASLEDFRPAAQALIGFLDDWAASTGFDVNQIDLMGFSQGAAMSYSLTLLYPQRIHQLAALSGFLPNGGVIPDLTGKPVFISHGRQDEMIPVEQSRLAAVQLEKAGALVTYCESDTGHKVSKECLKALELFLGLS